MAQERKIYEVWRMMRNERLRYYSDDTGRLFKSGIIKEFSSIFPLSKTLIGFYLQT